MQTELPENCEWYREQIAGHHPSVFKNGQYEIGFIKERGSSYLLKPVQEGIRGQREVIDLLNKPVNNERQKVLIEFAQFLPKFYGLKQIYAGNKTIDCLVMEDLTEGYKQPCTMDIKMGKVTYDPDAPPEKIMSESVKYPAQTTLGFRLLGYRMHCNGDCKIRDKKWGRSRTLENIVSAYGEFLSGRRGEETVLTKHILSQLYKIQQWFHAQRVYHFYASSILIVYEACIQLEARPLVKLIDFSHVFPSNGDLDENYIFGLDNVVRFIEQFQNEIQQQKVSM
uniref:Kinase n=1 Tax=Syphacia muris TaxID=451379 RepID=A0A0N5AD59_9BILA